MTEPYPELGLPDGPVVVRNCWFLGLYSREMIVERANPFVTMVQRFFWLFTSVKRIQVSDIRCLAYNYEGPSSSAVTEAFSDECNEDRFTIGLRLQDGIYVHCISRSGTS